MYIVDSIEQQWRANILILTSKKRYSPAWRKTCFVSIVKKARKSRTWQWASGHIRSRSEEYMRRVLGDPRKLKKITRFSFPLLLKRKKYFTNPSCVPHWERKTSPRSTAPANRIGLQPFLRTRSYPALVLCSATAVGADFAVRPKARQYTRQALKRTESLIVPNTSPTQALWLCWCCWRLDNWSQSLKIQRQAPRVLSRINEKNSWTISEGAPLAARC